MDGLEATGRLEKIRMQAEVMASMSRKTLDEEVEEVKGLLRRVDTGRLLSEADYSLPMVDFLDKAEMALLQYGIESGEF